MKQNKPDSIQIPFTEKLKSIPEVFGIRLNEEPEFEVIKRDGPVELRRYSKQLRASITLQQRNYEEFCEDAFRILASYLFGENQSGKKIPMTSPVLIQPNIDQSWTMSFILPARCNFQNLPEPIHSDIRLKYVDSYEAVALSYTGNNTPNKIKANQEILAKWLLSHKFVRKDGPFIVAQYDAPFVIPFLKKNEIQVKIAVNLN